MTGKKPTQTGPPNKRTYVDSTTGRKVNDYIPKFISSTPWYYSNEALSVDSRSRKRKTDDELYKEIKDKSTDRLKHQRLNPGAQIIPNNEARRGLGINDEFDVIVDIPYEDEDKGKESKIRKLNAQQKNSIRRKMREWKKKGRCENCGGKHSKADCLEKPHSLSHLYENGGNIEAERKEHLVKRDTDDWDTKRDRWRGVEMDEEYDGIVENLKRKEEEVLKKYLEKNPNSSEIASVEATDKHVESGSSDSTAPPEGKSEREKETDTLIKAITDKNPLALDPTDTTVITRSLGAKPRYLEVIKTGEELRYNPKSRVYKDLKEGYLNERNQFIPFLTGEAAEFEKLKKFNRTIQQKQRKKWVEDKEGTKKVTATEFATEISPTSAMLKLKEKEEQDRLVREAKKRELLEKYGAL